MLAYYGSRISAHMTRTPEGFLICHDVPIARTGIQEYLGRELPGIDADPDERIEVNRPPDEVLDDAVLASFEGKPVTSPHPPKEVGPDDWSRYAKGHVQNVRKGSGEQDGHILADLVIMDANLISAIDGGLREVSCGYACGYRQTDGGTVEQHTIRGNHVAVVQTGRAGESVAIQDSAPEGADQPKAERRRPMSKSNILARMLKAFAKDAEPEEVAEAIDAFGASQTPPQAAGSPPAEKDPITVLADAIKQLQADVAEIKKSGAPEPGALDALESELTGDTEPASEGSKTIEETSDEAAEGETAEGEKTADSGAILRMVRAMKPYVAMLPPEERARAADSLSAAIRESRGKPAKPTTDGYGGIMQTVAARGEARVRDAEQKRKQAATEAEVDLAAVSKAYQARNPHINQGGK